MDTDDLYGLALDEFVPQRGALAKSLRAEKRRDEAAQVAGLRKPSIAAWAVNQLVRTQHDAVKALFEAGDGLRGAQEDLLAGRGDGRKLRAANQREREAVDTLVEAARGLLTSGGYELSAAVVERVDETLHAAALDEEARDQVRDGRLERELRHAGLGLGFGEALAATPASRAKRADAAPAATEGKGGAKPGGARKGGAAKGGAAKGGAKKGGAKGEAKTGEGRGRAKRGTADDAEATATKPSADERRAERERAAAEREQAKRAERERAEARKAARAAETAARRRADVAARALEKAERRREDAAQALSDADDALTDAREESDEAAAEHERAQAGLDEI
jgi:hypothetical protein